MSITTPTQYDPINPEALLGRLAFAADPLETLLEQTNYLYRYHSPPAVNVAILAGARSGVSTIYVPIQPSADAVNYAFTFAAHMTSAASITFDAYGSSTGSSPGGGWGVAILSGATSAWAGAGTEYRTGTLGVIPANTTHLKVEWTPAAGSCQPHCLMLYPAPTSTPAGPTAAGFVAYDDDWFSGAGAPINTELINRVHENVAAVVTDRVHQVVGWAVEANVATRFAASGSASRRMLWQVSTAMPGQSGAVVTARCRADDSASGGKIYVQTGVGPGDACALDCDDTDVTGSLTLRSDKPVFTAALEAAANTQVYYLCIDWRPGD